MTDVQVSEADREFRPLTDDESDEVTFYVDEWPDGRTSTQHRAFIWGDHVIVLGELNHHNNWNDREFANAEAALEAALSDQSTAQLQEEVERLREANQRIIYKAVMAIGSYAAGAKMDQGWAQRSMREVLEMELDTLTTNSGGE